MAWQTLLVQEKQHDYWNNLPGTGIFTGQSGRAT
jgi:hypothetical protein